jgi:hypothetical protein
MKNIIFILLLVFVVSCSKKDKINHYLNEKVTEMELVENGFYKYSYTYTYENDEDEKDTLNGKIFKNVLYSNVKPQRQDDGKLYPIPLFSNKNNSKENTEYLVNELDNRIISYLFINDTLEYKSIFVYSVNKNKKHIANFTSKENIINYYNSLKIQIKPLIDGKKSTKEHTTLFLIDNYKTRIYFERYPGVAYDMITNYGKNSTPYMDTMEGWYNGYTYELSK